MIFRNKTNSYLFRCCLLIQVAFYSSIAIGQDIILYDQFDVDNFHPGSVYNGNITIGKGTGGGSPDEITDLSNLSVLQRVNGNLRIKINAELKNLDDLSALRIVSGIFEIRQNLKLEDLDGLSNLDSVGFDLIISNNELLDDISGLDNVSTISGKLSIMLNISLLEVDHFSNLTETTEIDIQSNVNISSINGFQNLDSCYNIRIRNCNLLKEITGFSNIKSVKGFFNIGGNYDLSDISGFSNITEVGYFEINGNLTITNLDAFENIKKVNNNLTIFGNYALFDCCGIYHLLDDPNAISGSIIIFNNPMGCSSEQEILEEYCGLHFNYSVTPACINQNNGSIQINVTSYDAIPFSYDWEQQENGQMGSGTSMQNFFSIDMLEAGTYNVTVTILGPDDEIETDIVVPELNGNIFEVIKVESTNSSNGFSNGSIQLVLSGGAQPYDVTWSGAASGSLTNVASDTINILFIPAGEYTIFVTDDNNIQQEVSITLLDDIVPVFPCTEALDIIILNDVSGSVNTLEYRESKEFFVHFLQAANIGTGMDKSRAAIIEWSSPMQQEVKVPITGNINLLNAYEDATRSFNEGTAIHEALAYGEEYFDIWGRPDVEKVIVLATDATLGQAPGSLVAFADQLKAKGFHILTIAFDAAFEDIATRQILSKMASIGALAPGAPSYGQLDQNLAENIVNIYLCPIDPGESSNVYFGRDGSITIDELIPQNGCPNPDYVDVKFTIEAFRELSVPGGTPVTFYLNDPKQFGATRSLTWQIPCSIATGESETYTITLPTNGPSHIFAVLNDDGESGIPISFPITQLDEISYSNNIDDEWVCLGDFPTIQVLKYTTTPTPSCDTIVKYTINVCNISDTNAFGIEITDQPPAGFALINTVVNLNDCAVDNNGIYDIAAGCCLSLFLSYDAAGAPWGYYGDQDVLISGPSDQEYFSFDGATTTAEDVTLDGTIECPSTIVEFTKEVDRTESCDDAYLTYTFTINNELNFPLQGLTFIDIVPMPSTWVFEPYNVSGMSIGIKSINEQSAQFIIDEVQANTVATFSFDLSLGFWDEAGTLLNSAELGNVPDVDNGGIKTLTSNTTSTDITPTTPIELPDTLYVQIEGDTLIFEIALEGQGTAIWTSQGDGTILEYTNPIFRYALGIQDKEDRYVVFDLEYETECYETTEEVVVILQECSLEFVEFTVNECDDNGTPGNADDDTHTVNFNISAMNPGSSMLFELIIGNDTIGAFTYNTAHVIPLPADGMDRTLIFVDQQFGSCMLTEVVNVENCSDPCILLLEELIITDCNDSGTPGDNSDDFFNINFIAEADFPGLDSTFSVVIGNDTLVGFPYFEEHTITIAASNNISAVQFIDSENSDCLLTVNVGIENCIYPCEMLLDQFSVSDCDDAGTIDEPSDDTFTLTFNLISNYPGLDSLFHVIIDGDTIGSLPYETEHTITLPADGMDHTIEFVDGEFSECIVTEVVNVSSCSSPCTIEWSLFTQSECNDNGTPTDPSDDFFILNFNATADNPGIDSMYWFIVDNDTIGSFNYDSDQLLMLPAIAMDIDILCIDTELDNCFLTESIQVESCSDECALALTSFIISECNDNTTEIDQTDDYFEIQFELSAANPGIDFTFYALVDNDTIGEFSYTQIEIINLPADGINHILTFVDSQNETCLISETIAVSHCSTQCQMVLNSFSVSECLDQGTGDDITDDIFEVIFEVSGLNLSNDSMFLLLVDLDTFGIYTYYNNHMITLPAGSNEYELIFVDHQSPECSRTEKIRVENCSYPCELIIETFDLSICDDNGTPGASEDDTYSLTFNASILSEFDDSNYTLLLDGESLGEFEYDNEYAIEIPNSGGVSTIDFIDNTLSYCIQTEQVNLISCEPKQDIVIPNAFSPNDDNINDEWTIHLSNGSQVISCSIYDRWGSQMYTNSQGEIPIWDGSINGKKVSSGVYVYVIVYENEVAGVQTKYGDVTVVY